MSIPKTGDRFSLSDFSHLLRREVGEKNLSEEEAEQLANQLDTNDGAKDGFISVMLEDDAWELVKDLGLRTQTKWENSEESIRYLLSDSRNGCAGTRSPEFLADFLQENAKKMGVELSYADAFHIGSALAEEENNADKNITLRNFSDIVLKPQMIAFIHERFPQLDAENVGTALAITLDPQMSIAPPRALATPKSPMTIPQLMEFVEAGLGDDPVSRAAYLLQLELMLKEIPKETEDPQLVLLSKNLLFSVKSLIEATNPEAENVRLKEVQASMAHLQGYLRGGGSGIAQRTLGGAEEAIQFFKQSPKPFLYALAITAALAITIEEFGKRYSKPGQQPPPEKQPPEKRPCISDTPMIPIPGGVFDMGSASSQYKDEKPMHLVTISHFSFDQHTVTVEQFDACLEAQGKMSERPKLSRKFDKPKRPMLNVTWSMADAYCKAVGKRLPTEGEWEYVAKGPKHTLEFPIKYGKKPSKEDANWGHDWIAGSTADVCSYSGHYVVWGGKEICDLAGNVWEWLSDWFGTYPDFPVENPQGPEEGEDKVLRGGFWADFLPDMLRSAYRYKYDPRSPGMDGFGFRCAVGTAAVVPPKDALE